MKRKPSATITFSTDGRTVSIEISPKKPPKKPDAAYGIAADLMLMIASAHQDIQELTKGKRNAPR